MTHPLYQDVVPYDVPTSLDALRGPARGELDLPHSLHWGPDRHIDLDQFADQVAMYQAVVREGTSAQQETFLNQTLLHMLWHELALPTRCREAWETAFPELRHPDAPLRLRRDPVADVLRHQRQVTRLVLAQLADSGFALAGSGAIREHGLTSRPTEDVDLFAATPDRASFDAAVGTTVAVLRQSGYTVVHLRRAELFGRLEVTSGDGTVLEVDLGIDWRAHPPVLLEVGPVLAVEDAVANKVGALYSRGEARDYLDVDKIRQSGRFTDFELLQFAADHDPGFDVVRFAEQLHRVGGIHPRQVEQYGTTAAQFVDLQRRLNAWAAELVPD